MSHTVCVPVWYVSVVVCVPVHMHIFCIYILWYVSVCGVVCMMLYVEWWWYVCVCVCGMYVCYMVCGGGVCMCGMYVYYMVCGGHGMCVCGVVHMYAIWYMIRYVCMCVCVIWYGTNITCIL